MCNSLHHNQDRNSLVDNQELVHRLKVHRILCACATYDETREPDEYLHHLVDSALKHFDEDEQLTFEHVIRWMTTRPHSMFPTRKSTIAA